MRCHKMDVRACTNRGFGGPTPRSGVPWVWGRHRPVPPQPRLNSSKAVNGTVLSAAAAAAAAAAATAAAAAAAFPAATCVFPVFVHD